MMRVILAALWAASLFGQAVNNAPANMVTKDANGNVAIGAMVLNGKGIDLGFDFYVDSVNGNDDNSGTSPYRPFKTIAKLLTQTITAGTKIGLAANSVWREELLIPAGAEGAYVDAYGFGAQPHLNAADVIATTAWAKTDGFTNLYSAAALPVATGPQSASGHRMNVWQDGVYLTRVASLATCDSTLNSYYTTDETTTPVTITVNVGGDPASDGSVYEYARRQSGFNSQTNAVVAGTVRNIQTSHNLSSSGSLILGSWTADNIVASDGNRHNVYITPGGILKDSEVARAYDGGEDIIMVVYNGWTMAGTESITFDNVYVHDAALGSAIGGHSNDTTKFGTVEVKNSRVANVPTAYSFGDVNHAILTNSTAVTGISIAEEGSGLIDTIISGCTLTGTESATKGLNSGAVTISTSTLTAGEHGVYGNTTGAVTLTGNTVTMTLSEQIPVYLFGASASLVANGNTFTRYASTDFVYNVPASITYSGNNNTFPGSGALFSVGGSSKTLAQWQTLTGGDAASIQYTLPAGASVQYDFVQGSNALTLYDLSGNARHASLSATTTPTWSASGLTFLANGYVALPSSYNTGITNAATVVLVSKNTASGENAPPLWFGAASGAGYYPFSNGDVYLDTLRATRVGGIANGSFDKTAWHMLAFSAKAGAGGYVAYQNTSVLTTQAGDSFSLNNTRPRLGTSADEATTYAGSQAYFLLWPRGLTAAEITQVYNWLKYRELPAKHAAVTLP